MRFRFYAVKISAVILAVFALQVFVGGFTQVFILNQNSLGEPWRFLTAIFLHGGAVHLLYNLFALLLFGSVLEKLIGGKKFMVVFFTTGVLANIISVNFYGNSLGASGAIFGVIGALILIKPLMAVWAFGMPMPIFVAGIIWAVGDVLGAYGFFTGNPINNTGNIAHLSGLFFGLVFGYFYRRKIKNKIYDAQIDEKELRKWEDAYLK